MIFQYWCGCVCACGPSRIDWSFDVLFPTLKTFAAFPFSYCVLLRDREQRFASSNSLHLTKLITPHRQLTTETKNTLQARSTQPAPITINQIRSLSLSPLYNHNVRGHLNSSLPPNRNLIIRYNLLSQYPHANGPEQLGEIRSHQLEGY